MPLYEYSCSACDHRFEILQALGADGESLTCPACSAAGVRKVFSTFAASSHGQTGNNSPAGCGSGFT